MVLTLPIVDETTSGSRQSAGDFRFDSETLTLRELIRRRVQQEVGRYNQSDEPEFRGLIQPGETERILNGVRERRVLDWQRQCDKAIAAFQSNGFVVLVDDRQITDLDDPIELTAQTRISFLKLVPLVGG